MTGRSVGVFRQALAEFARPGASGVTGASLWRAGQVAIALAIVVTNMVGAVVVVVMGTLVIPMPTIRNFAHVRAVDTLAAAAYVIVAVVIGVLVGIRGLFRLRDWLVAERPATETEVRIVLRAPVRLFVVQMVLWAAAAVVFGVLNWHYSSTLGLRVAVAVLLTGLSTAACAYLLTERLLRPAAARALATGAPDRLAVPGVAARAVLAWALGTGVPVTGLVLIGVAELTTASGAHTKLAIAVIVLGAISLTVGLLAAGVAARATADPVDAVRRGLRRVQEGDLGVAVPVYDGTQLGQLQLGFNRMVEGLAERERIREALGIYLDPDIAERVVNEGTRLEGEEVEVTVMFVDVRNFTTFAEGRPAQQVVATLNRLFSAIVPIVHREGGRVDKFVGDGLLAVFGAPRKLADHADRALAAAVAIADAVHGELEIGIGLNSGRVVAGNVGGSGRLEFSVIGDVVNTAARVEGVTRSTGDVILLAEATKELLRQPWPALIERDEFSLKGKATPVALYAHPASVDGG
ncbi:MAG: adenylate/guanylate cyclase domain-containing protein [Actinobacteria bacterium]|nr:adenylate/guanylate cyclase domain-containing protein [Actinomycetota bacterium]